MTAPDDDPYITLVGGTALATAGPGAAWLSETVWNAQEGPGFNVSAGGVSTTYSIPSWQTGVNMSTNSGSTTKRNSPDVAMVADNVFIVADDGQLETTGGTSVCRAVVGGLRGAGQPTGRGRRRDEHRLPQPGPLSHRHQLRLYGLL